MTNERPIQQIKSYYDQKTDLIPSGAGLVWFMSEDQLHPPMINDEQFWTSTFGWKEGAKETVRSLIELGKVDKDHLILDIGCGIGGPGRQIARATQAKVFELNISGTQLRTAKKITTNQTVPENNNIEYLQADGNFIPLPSASIDRVFSVNMFYHFSNLEQITSELHRVVKTGGLILIDDWFLTDSCTENTRNSLRQEWNSPGGFHKLSDTLHEFEKHHVNVVKNLDLTESGKRFLNEEYFGKTFDNQVRPKILQNFSKIYQYPEYKPDHAELAASQLKHAVMYMGELYNKGEAVYVQLALQKSNLL